MITATDISFVHLGIRIEHLRNNILISGFPITFYEMIIDLGVLVSTWAAQPDARRRRQSPEDYLDFVLHTIILSIIGAGFYYIAFAWDNYEGDLLQIPNLRAGGSIIYGGVIAVVITLIVYTRVKELPLPTMADSDCPGLATGQVIGCWGNSFNCEALGGYTDNPLAVRLKRSLINESITSSDLINHLIVESDIEYIQVHLIFLYESVQNLGILAFMLWYRYRKKFEGGMALIYLFNYGLGRV